MKAKVKHTENFDKLVESIKEHALYARQLTLQVVSQYTPIVDEINKSKSTDVKHIELTLDQMLDFCSEDIMLQPFKKLCRNYYTIDPVAAAEYILLYREI